MVEGVGIDLVETRRVARTIERWGDRFLQRVFTQRELSYCASRAGRVASLAARFAAKEAVLKALGTGVSATTGWRDIEILNEDSGKPCVRLSRGAATAAQGRRVLVSLTHSGGYALAQAVLVAGVEKREGLHRSTDAEHRQADD